MGAGLQKKNPGTPCCVSCAEIGLTSHGTVTAACELEEEVDYKRDLVSLFHRSRR